MSPRRIQRKRTKGWRMPLCSCGCGKPARYVGRPTKWGNPFKVSSGTKTSGTVYGPGYFDGAPDCAYISAAGGENIRKHLQSEACRIYRQTIESLDVTWPKITVDDIRRELAGHDLACWCAPGKPCHADVLLELANPEADR